MLIFATGIVIVGLLFLGFTSNIQVSELARNTLFDVEKVVQERLSSENLWASKDLTIPDVLYYGVNKSTPFFYDLSFSKVSLNSSSVGEYNALVISISEHGKTKVIASRMIPMKANIILVDPGIIIGEDMANLSKHYDKNQIILYPRSAKKGAQVAPANSFIVMKETISGKQNLYIIPCSSMLNPPESTGLLTNCTSNLLMIGCYNLSKTNPPLTDTVSDSFVSAVTNHLGVEMTNVTWEKCLEVYPHLRNIPN
jgi:hypothetical protein